MRRQDAEAIIGSGAGVSFGARIPEIERLGMMLYRAKNEFRKAPLAVILGLTALLISAASFAMSIFPDAPKLAVTDIFNQKNGPTYPGQYATQITISNLGRVDADVLAWMVLLDDHLRPIAITNAEPGESSQRLSLLSPMSVNLVATSDSLPHYVVVCMDAASMASWKHSHASSTYKLNGALVSGGALMTYQRAHDPRLDSQIGKCASGLSRHT